MCDKTKRNGFISISNSIYTLDEKSKKVSNIDMSYQPNSTQRTLVGNKIDESKSTSCTYKSKEYKLFDAQICTSIHKNYKLPTSTNTQKPVAELIFSFRVDSPNEDITAILFCFPIYTIKDIKDINPYLHQLVKDPIPTKQYTTETTGSYEIKENTKKGDSKTLIGCINEAISKNTGDESTKINNYQYENNTCYLFTTPNTIKGDMIHGEIKNIENSARSTTTYANIDSLFKSDYLSYTTCINSTTTRYAKAIKTRVCIFPNGLSVTSDIFNQLALQMGVILKPYKFYDNDIIKQNIEEAHCDCNNTSAFIPEYYKPVNTKGSVVGISEKPLCPFKSEAQYKCVPFNKLKTISTCDIGTTTLPQYIDDILKSHSVNSQTDIKLTPVQLAAIGITVVGLIGITGLVSLSIYMYKRKL